MEFGSYLTALVFDFDGTLFDLDVDWAALRRELRVPDGEPLGGVMQRMVEADDPLLNLITDHELRAVGDHRVMPDIAVALEKLADRYALAVCTRNSRMAVARAFEGVAVGPKLAVIGREDVRRLKPDPDGPLRLLDHFSVPPTSAALIGDTFHDVQAARAAGIHSIVVRNKRLAYVPEGADLYIELISDLVTALD